MCIQAQYHLVVCLAMQRNYAAQGLSPKEKATWCQTMQGYVSTCVVPLLLQPSQWTTIFGRFVCHWAPGCPQVVPCWRFFVKVVTANFSRDPHHMPRCLHIIPPFFLVKCYSIYRDIECIEKAAPHGNLLGHRFQAWWLYVWRNIDINTNIDI